MINGIDCILLIVIDYFIYLYKFICLCIEIDSVNQDAIVEQ